MNTAFILFNMSHRQCPWCACLSSHVSNSQVGRMMDIAPRGHSDIQRDTWHVSTWVLLLQVGTTGLFLYLFALSVNWHDISYATCATSSDATSDKWKWENWIIHSNYTAARTHARPVWFSLRSGGNKLNKGNESYSVWLMVYYLILINQQANIAPFQEYYFELSAGVDQYTSYHGKALVCSCIRQWMTWLLRLFCTGRISTLVLLFISRKGICVTVHSRVCCYLDSDKIFWQKHKP